MLMELQFQPLKTANALTPHLIVVLVPFFFAEAVRNCGNLPLLRMPTGSSVGEYSEIRISL